MTNSLQLHTIEADAIEIQGQMTQQMTETDTMFPTRRAYTPRFTVSALGMVATFGLSALLSGCTTALPTGLNVALPISGAAKFSGIVHGGQGPVIGASVQLYTVGTGTLKSASTGLITTTLPLTDANGNFSITGKYNCSSATDVYLVATGGNPGGGTNGNLALVAALGPCATLLANAATTYTTINEMTTVAAAYALAPFAANYSTIGSPSALDIAFGNANLLVNPSNGIAGSGVATGVTVPVAELNTLGDIIAACVNTNGATASPATPNACNTLMTATGATDTFGAALSIAQHPGSSASTGLYTLSSSTAPFQPSVSYSSAPNDYSVAVTFAGTGSTLATPYGVAIDASGDAWVTNETGTSVTEFSPTGTLLATPTAANLVGAEGIALDRTGNVWVANTAGNSVIKFAVSGGAVTGSATFTAGGVLAPAAIALDSAGNAFVANLNGNSVTGLTSAGAALSNSPFTGSSNNITLPSGIALDKSGNVYVTSGTGSLIELTNAGAYSATLNDGTLQGPTSVATDASGNIVATGFTTGSAVSGALSQFNSGAASPISPVTTGLSTPAGVASDGTSFWVANSIMGGSLAQFTYGSATPASPIAGFGSLNTPIGVAIDAFGSVWTTNSGSNLVSKFIGIAAPVATPVAVNVGP